MSLPLREAVWQFLTKLKTILTFDPAVLFIGVYLTDFKSGVHISVYVQIFMIDLLDNCCQKALP